MDTHPALTVVALINGMIGGVILVLPLLALEAGSVLSPIVIVLSGLCSWYSCRLCVKHLGHYRDLDDALMGHFGNSRGLKIFYDAIVFLNLFLLLILYFELIVQQWEGLLPASLANPVSNFALLLVLVLAMKYYELGVSLLAYGIVSTIGYCVFLVALLATAPQGENKMDKFGSGGVKLAAAMGQAFTIQTFFIPVLRKNGRHDKYQHYTMVAYAIGLLVYLYIAEAGSLGILNRTPYDPQAQTLEQYFSRGHWQLGCLELIYLVHLYSVFPQFLLISNKRMFGILSWPLTPRGQISTQEIVYALLMVGVCLGVSLGGLDIGRVIELNGAVVGFFFIYALPIALHLKCHYLDGSRWRKVLHLHDKGGEKQIEIVAVEAPKSETEIAENLLPPKQTEKPSMEPLGLPQGCQSCQSSSPLHGILDVTLMLGMLSIGIFIMYEGVSSMFSA